MKRTSLIIFLICTFFLVGCGGGPTASDDHEHGEFEWIGEFDFEAGTYLFHFGACEDSTMDVAFVKMGDNIVDLSHHAAHLMLTDKEIIDQDSEFIAQPDYAYTLEMDKEHGHIHFIIEDAGVYALVTEHMPFESNMQVFDAENVEILPLREHEAVNHEH